MAPFLQFQVRNLPNPAWPFIHYPGTDLWSEDVCGRDSTQQISILVISQPPLQLGQAHVTHAAQRNVRGRAAESQFVSFISSLL